MTVTPAQVNVRKNGLSTATVAVTILNASTAISVTAVTSNSREISVSPATATVAAGGSANFTLTSLRQNTGFTYQATFRSADCGSASVTVSVKN